MQRSEEYKYLKWTSQSSSNTVPWKVLEDQMSFQQFTETNPSPLMTLLGALKSTLGKLYFINPDIGSSLQVKIAVIKPISVTKETQPLSKTRNTTFGANGDRIHDIRIMTIEYIMVFFNLMMMIFGPE